MLSDSNSSQPQDFAANSPKMAASLDTGRQCPHNLLFSTVFTDLSLGIFEF
jgi:hypothetical protein